MNNKKTFAILIAGSRHYDNYNEFCEIMNYNLSRVKDFYNILIIHGGAFGADNLANRYANENSYELKVFSADWDLYGKSAGYRRNVQMHNFINEFDKRACMCFWDGQSKGTQHNFKLSNNNKTQLRVYNYIDKKMYSGEEVE
jgi:hypothetical protein